MVNHSTSDLQALRRNHFEFFSLSPAFDLDESALEQAFRRVQSAVHPDRFVNAGEAERRYAMQLAAQANEAFRTLADPLTRAAYLCELNGRRVGAEDNTAMAPDFLIEQMEWREGLDEAQGRGDIEAVTQLLSRTAAERLALQGKLQQLIDVQRDFEAAALLVRQYMFIDRFASQVRAVSQAMAG